MPFLHKYSSKITFLTAKIYISKSAYKIIKALRTDTNMYKSRGFNKDVYHRDNKFK